MLKKSIHLFIAFLAICSLLLVSNTSKKEENNAIKNELKLKKSQVKNADGSITITITYQVLPSEATDKSVTLSLSWSDSSVSDDVNDYLLIEHDASNFEIAITMLKRATTQAKLTITSNSNPGVSAVILIDFEQEVEEPEELTDLTNTVWNIPAGSTYGVSALHFNSIQGTINEKGFIGLSLAFDGEYSTYDSDYITYLNDAGVPRMIKNTTDITIKFTGGTDVTNTQLISWLQENATQVIPLTDLTNTTWSFTSWNDTNSAKGFYQINMIVDDIEYTELGIGYMSMGSGNYESDYGSLYFNGDNGNTHYTYNGLSTLKITGGRDVTNTTLISWLQENGTLQ